VQAASAQLVNDVPTSASKIYIRDIAMTGVRLKATRISNGPPGPIDPEILQGTFNDNGDPPLLAPLPAVAGGLPPDSSCTDRQSVQNDPTNPNWYATRTVWYEITQDSRGAPFNQSVLVTVDAAGSSFATALQVYQGSGPPARFTRGVSPLPGRDKLGNPIIVACDEGTINQGPVPAAVSFVAQRGTRYFLMAGVAPNVSPGTNLRLSMRYLDVSAPPVTVRSLDAVFPDVSQVFSYQVSSADASANPRKGGVSVQQIHGQSKVPLLKLGVGASDCDAKAVAPYPGRYCVDDNPKSPNVFVRWRSIKAPGDTGQVTASFVDAAGNVGVNSLSLPVRDRKPPVISGAPRVRWSRKGRLFVSTRCTGGPGRIRVEVTTGGKPALAGQKAFRTRHTMILKQAFKKVRRKTLFVHIVCFDQSNNSTDRWLFLPR
jgi:hypothetical protein